MRFKAVLRMGIKMDQLPRPRLRKRRQDSRESDLLERLVTYAMVKHRMTTWKLQSFGRKSRCLNWVRNAKLDGYPILFLTGLADYSSKFLSTIHVFDNLFRTTGFISSTSLNYYWRPLIDLSLVLQ